jgi:protein-arginine kinase activator protein McsA
VNGKKEEHHYCAECLDKASPFGKIIRGLGEHIGDDVDDDFYDNCELDENGVPFEYSVDSDENVTSFDVIEGIARIAAKEIYAEEKRQENDKNSVNGIYLSEKYRKGEPLVVCPVCGTTSELIYKTRRAGCAKCYNVFETFLMDRYRMCYNAHAYHGKVYCSKNVNKDVDYLQSELSAAVKSQNYGRAAEICDNIKKLQTTKSGSTKKCKRGKVE